MDKISSDAVFQIFVSLLLFVATGVFILIYDQIKGMTKKLDSLVPSDARTGQTLKEYARRIEILEKWKEKHA